MRFSDFPIRKKLMVAILMTSAMVLLLTCMAFFAYDFFTFRQAMITHLSTIGKITAANSTAALAFDSRGDAEEILSSLTAEQHIIAACLFDREGKRFAGYQRDTGHLLQLPEQPGKMGFSFQADYLEGYHPVLQGNSNLGTLYIRSDMGAIYERIGLYTLIVVAVIAIACLMAYLISNRMQRRISRPIQALAETARAISERNDYSVRVSKVAHDEIGDLTDAFNHMLAQIRSFNLQLEMKVQERTIEMEAANKELEAFSYSVSHDLRAPLRSIHGYMNIFAEDYASQLDDEARRLMNIILLNSRRMGQLIDDLLEFSRLGRKEITKARISMKDMVTSIAGDLKRTENNNRPVNITILDLPEAHADFNTMQHVWTNLITNALKYSRNKGETRIEIGSLEKEGDQVFYVKDNGAGFDMRYYDKLFGVFQRLHSINEFEGTGVGLAIVHRIITKHHGRIWAEAKPNEGATFYFTLSRQTS
ncbi:MAG TPA: ATP-binding protein [Ohtaekwangia sp.]